MTVTPQKRQKFKNLIQAKVRCKKGGEPRRFTLAAVDQRMNLRWDLKSTVEWGQNLGLVSLSRPNLQGESRSMRLAAQLTAKCFLAGTNRRGDSYRLVLSTVRKRAKRRLKVP